MTKPVKNLPMPPANQCIKKLAEVEREAHIKKGGWEK